jgi:DNA polymerase-3 subunit beta
MEVKITVPAEHIAVLKLFAANNDVRYYLNGINLEIGRTESRLVATNGHMLGCFRIESEQPGVYEPLTNVIIPNDLLKAVKDKGRVEITIGPTETEMKKDEPMPVSQSRPVTLTYAGMSMSGKTIDGEFPKWRNTIPTKVSGEAAQFDPHYIGMLSKAWIIMHGNKGHRCVGIGHNGDGAALIDMDNANFVGLIMPMRLDAPVSPPDWWADSLRVATDSAAEGLV